MRLKVTKTNKATNYYIIRDINKNGKRSTEIYERLGTEEEILKRSNGEDIFVWIKNYIKEINENKNNIPTLIKKYPSKIIDKAVQNLFNCGYLFLEKIYYEI